MEEHNILIPLLLTLGAGLATGIGSAIAFFAKRTNKRLLSFSLGLSGGVMIYVSFVELFQQANTTLSAEWGAHTGVIVTVASFFAGILLIGVIDRLVPSIENPHEAHRVEEMDHQPHNPRLMRMGVMTALHGLTHGATLAIVFNGTLRVLREQKRDKILQYGARIWGIVEGTDDERIDRTIARTEEFFRSLGLSTRLSEEGIGRETILEIERRFDAAGVRHGEAQNVDGALARRILEACL